MNFDTSSEQDEFISRVNNACRNLRESEERAYIEEKFDDKLVT